MKEVAFHFNVQDKMDYACRLLRKAVGSGAKVVVCASTDLLQELDAMLWTFSQLDFVPHVRLPAEHDLVENSSVLLTENPLDGTQFEVLLNLGEDVPKGFEQYERMIEIVGMSDADRQFARLRWKHYSAQEIPLVRHDLSRVA